MTEGTWSATPEQRTPRWQGHELASFKARVGATLVDGLILFPLGIFIHFLLTGRPFARPHPSAGAQLGTIAIAVVVALAYYVPQMVRWNGRTVGKRALGLRVVRASGAEMTAGVALLREIFCKTLAFGIGILDVFVGGVGLVAVIDYLWVPADSQNRALHDFAARTRVIRESG